MEVTCSSETSVGFQRVTQRYIPEGRTLHNHYCENLKSYREWIFSLWFNVMCWSSLTGNRFLQLCHEYGNSRFLWIIGKYMSDYFGVRMFILWRIDPLLGKYLETNKETTTVAMKRRCKHTSTAIELPMETMFSTWFVQRNYIEDNCGDPVTLCGGGIEFLHRSPASRRRQPKGNSRIWDSKIWSRVPEDSDPRMTALLRASSNCKRQTHPVVREDVT
jgi:hypothetical protein